MGLIPNPLWRLPVRPNPPHRPEGEVQDHFTLPGWRVEYVHHPHRDGAYDQAVRYWRLLPEWEMLATPTSVPRGVQEEACARYGGWARSGRPCSVALGYWEWVGETLERMGE